jgi:hypothetical protein
MKPYTKEYMLTDSIFQDARDWANKLQLFGSAKKNAQHARGVLDHVQRLGHKVEMIFQDQQKLSKQLGLLCSTRTN